MTDSPDTKPEEVVYYATDCEALIDYDLAVYLGKNDECSLVIEERLLHRLSVDEKISLLKILLSRHGIVWEPYANLPSELRALFEYRNSVAHSSPLRGDNYQRARRRKGANELFRTTPSEAAEYVASGIRCQSALTFLPTYLARQQESGGRSVDDPDAESQA